MRRLDTLVTAEISHRLSSYALDAESSVAMNELRQCVVSQFFTCPPTSRVEHWLGITLNRDDIPPSQRMVFLITLARIAAHKGNLEESFRLLEEALGLTENDVGILIEMALLNSTYGELEDARQLLNRIEPLVEASGRRLRDFRDLKVYLKEKSALASEAPPVH